MPPEIRFRTFWDREAAPIQKWHTFHLLMLSEPEDRRFRRFSTTLIHCADRLLLEVREAFIEDEEIGHDEGLQRDLWGDRVQTLLREDQTKLRESFEGWEVDGEAVCAWLTGGG